MIFHLASNEEWHDAHAAGTTYVPAAFADEGFIHCSYRHQLAGVVDRYYRDRCDLVVLEIDPVALRACIGTEMLVDEPSSSGELFPHVYAPLPCSVVRVVHPLAFVHAG